MIAVLDYGAGNLTSMRLALAHVGAEDLRVVKDGDAAAGAERIVFPGVGSAASAMAQLRARGFDALLRSAWRRGVPVLGVCIGMQLLFDASEEDGGVAGLGLLPGTVRRFAFPPGAPEKVPHMGWNRVEPAHPHPLLDGAAEPEAFYFVHSYRAVPDWDGTATPALSTAWGPMAATADANAAPAPRVCGWTEYGGARFAAAAGRGSFFAVQFHPERSGAAGLALLRRFLRWDGSPCC